MVTCSIERAARTLRNAASRVANGPSPARRVMAPEALSLPFVATCRTSEAAEADSAGSTTLAMRIERFILWL